MHGCTPLSFACLHKNEGIVSMLISEGKVVANLTTINIDPHIRSPMRDYA